jgi:segregation and condensation protein A
VAATLMRIKAKMLLPRPELDELGNEIDPREELIAHLLEYKKFKSVIDDLAFMEGSRMQKEKRGNILKELRHLSEINNVEAELQDIDLYRLLKVFEKCILRFEEEKNKPVHHVQQYPYTIEIQKEYIMNKVKGSEKVSFVSIIEESDSKIAVIYNFLSILELLQLHMITIHIGLGFNNFWIEDFQGEVGIINEEEISN